MRRSKAYRAGQEDARETYNDFLREDPDAPGEDIEDLLLGAVGHNAVEGLVNALDEKELAEVLGTTPRALYEWDDGIPVGWTERGEQLLADYAQGFDNEIGEILDELESLAEPPVNLAELRNLLETGELWEGAPMRQGELDWSSLPVFGGDEPDDTYQVWSWSETHLLVGASTDDLEIVRREDA